MSRRTSFKETSVLMKSLIEPQTVAIVGASGKIEKVGGAITRNALEGEYAGKIYLVNPNADRIFGREVYPTLEEVPDEIDLAEIVVPAPLVPMIMKQAVEKEVKGAIIVSSGFAETGRTDLQDQIVRIAKEGGIRVYWAD